MTRQGDSKAKGKVGKRRPVRVKGDRLKPDGRHARTLRTRAAIVDAFLALIREREEVPTAKAVAKRAGCSTRSVFERFSDFKELASASFDYVLQQGLSTPVGDTPSKDRATRIAFQVRVRATNCENWLPLWRVLTRASIGAKEALQIRMSIVREMSRARVRLMYEPELSTLSQWKRDATLIAIEALTDYESWGRMREHYKLSFEQSCEVWDAMIDQLLPP